jgi:PPOX class probable F420-dependent enzyme
VVDLDESARRKLDAPNLAFLATVMADASPQVSPVWIAREGGYITFNTAVGRVKERNIRRDPRVAISVVDGDDIYDRVCIRGRVAEMIDGEEADRQIDALAKKYLGVDTYPGHNPDEPRVKVLVEPISVSR